MYFSMPSMNPSTPSIFRAEPNQQGKTFLALMRARMYMSSRTPVSRYLSRAGSQLMAAASARSAVPLKSMHPGPSLF